MDNGTSEFIGIGLTLGEHKGGVTILSCLHLSSLLLFYVLSNLFQLQMFLMIKEVPTIKCFYCIGLKLAHTRNEPVCPHLSLTCCILKESTVPNGCIKHNPTTEKGSFLRLLSIAILSKASSSLPLLTQQDLPMLFLWV